MAIAAKACGKSIYGATALSVSGPTDGRKQRWPRPTSSLVSCEWPAPSSRSELQIKLTSTMHSPFGQSDLPTSASKQPLSFQEVEVRDKVAIPPTPHRAMLDSTMPAALNMSDDMIKNQPVLDYTTPDLVTLIISDLGPITPSVRGPPSPFGPRRKGFLPPCAKVDIEPQICREYRTRSSGSTAASEDLLKHGKLPKASTGTLYGLPWKLSTSARIWPPTRSQQSFSVPRRDPTAHPTDFLAL